MSPNNHQQTEKRSGRRFIYGMFDDFVPHTADVSLRGSMEAISACLKAYEEGGGKEMPNWLTDADGITCVAVAFIST